MLLRLGQTLPQIKNLTAGGSSKGSHQLMALQCERLYALKYLTESKSMMNPPWRLYGQLGHSCLAIHYGRTLRDVPEWLAPIIDRPIEDVLLEESDNNVVIVNNVLSVFDAYKRKYSTEGITPIAVEREFRIKIGELHPNGPWPELDDTEITCRVDLLALINGTPVIFDHKFTSGERDQIRLPDLDKRNKFLLSLQPNLYVSIVKHFLHEFGLSGTPLFMLNRVKRRAPYDFRRDLLDLSPLTVQETPAIVRGLLRKEAELIERMKLGHKPVPSFGSACVTDYGPCDYFDVCTAPTVQSRQSLLVLQDR